MMNEDSKFAELWNDNVWIGCKTEAGITEGPCAERLVECLIGISYTCAGDLGMKYQTAG